MSRQTDPNQVHVRFDDESMRLVDWYIDHKKREEAIELSRAEAVKALTVRMISWLKTEANKARK